MYIKNNILERNEKVTYSKKEVHYLREGQFV